MQRVRLHDLVQAEYPGQPGGCDEVVRGQRSDVFPTLEPRVGWGLPDVPLPLEPPAAQGLGLMFSLLHLGYRTEGGLQGRDTRELGLGRKLLPCSIWICDKGTGLSHALLKAGLQKPPVLGKALGLRTVETARGPALACLHLLHPSPLDFHWTLCSPGSQARAQQGLR